MKSYYQVSKGGYTLKDCIYRKTTNLISCYRHLEDVIRQIDDKESSGKIGEIEYTKRGKAKYYIKIIDKVAFTNMLPVEYQKAIFEHLVDKAEYKYLEKKYFLSTPAMKKYTQIFVYLVAKELREEF